MPPSAAQIRHIQQILQAYKIQMRAIIAKHKIVVKKALAESERRKTEKLLKSLKKI